MEQHNLKVYPCDPFAVDPLPRAHYFPSPPRNLGKAAKKTALSPERHSPPHPLLAKPLSYADEYFLQHANTYSTKTADACHPDDISKFDESWPSSERPSSASLTALEESPVTDVGQVCSQTLLDRFRDLKKTLEFTELDKADKLGQKGMKQKILPVVSKTKESSTIHRYIERFRHGKPMSREERKETRPPGQRDFWWASSNQSPPTHSSSSTPGSGEVERAKKKRISPSLPLSPYQSRELNSTTESEVSANANVEYLSEDKVTKQIQEKAERLLERSSSSLASSCPVVSTEGLGSSTSDISSFEEPSRRPAVTKRYDDLVKLKVDVPRSERVRPHPQEDILYQWRLKRKMEIARETPHFSRNVVGPSFKKLDEPVHETSSYIDGKLDEFKRQLASKVTSPGTKFRTGSVHITPAPPTVTQEMGTDTEVYSQNIFPEVEIEPTLNIKQNQSKSSSQNAPPIASPTLGKKRGTGDDIDLEPHLHLMCDLLPCPHGKVYKQQFSKVYETDEKGNYDDDQQTCYKQYLQAERPDVDKPTEIDSDRKSPIATGSSPMHSKSRARQKIERDEKSVLKKKPPEKERPDAKKSDVLNEEVQNKDSVVGEKMLDTGRAGPDVAAPMYSSSPKVRGTRTATVETVIGEVVKDRLFDLSSSTTVISSVESLPSFSTPERTVKRPCSKVTTEKQDESRQTIESGDEEYVSDGEFEDDQLLQLLRHQRCQFEEQLRQIDHQLVSLPPFKKPANKD